MSDPQKNFAAKLHASRVKYINTLPAKISEINLLWNQLNNNQWRAGVMLKMRNLVHNLAGAGGTFGLPDLSARAKELEIVLNTLQDNDDISPDQELLDKIQDLLIALQDTELTTIRTMADIPTPLNKADVIYTRFA